MTEMKLLFGRFERVLFHTFLAIWCVNLMAYQKYPFPFYADANLQIKSLKLRMQDWYSIRKTSTDTNDMCFVALHEV